MKLFYSPTSPYVRKVMAAAMLRGLDGRIERVTTNPHDSGAELVAQNPLSKVPCLVTDEGLALFDSPVICEYLDSLGAAPPLFPPPGRPRWQALIEQALADGVLDAAILYRREHGGAEGVGRPQLARRQQAVIARALDRFEHQLPPDPANAAPTIGTVSAVAALGYLDLRLPDLGWRAERPRLAAWFAESMRLPAFADTAPPAAA